MLHLRYPKPIHSTIQDRCSTSPTLPLLFLCFSKHSLRQSLPFALVRLILIVSWLDVKPIHDLRHCLRSYRRNPLVLEFLHAWTMCCLLMGNQSYWWLHRLGSSLRCTICASISSFPFVHHLRIDWWSSLYRHPIWQQMGNLSQSHNHSFQKH